MDTGHWILNDGVVITDETFGFLYEITNNITNRKYIGKKQCLFRIKRKPLKGKKRNRIAHNESDWKSYTGSSNSLNKDIETLGKDKFTFRILRTCNCKWDLAYYEIKEQIDREVLFKEEYYNEGIRCKVGKPPKEELLKYRKSE